MSQEEKSDILFAAIVGLRNIAKADVNLARRTYMALVKLIDELFKGDDPTDVARREGWRTALTKKDLYA